MSTDTSGKNGIVVTQAVLYNGPPVERPEGIPEDMAYVTTDESGQVVLHDPAAEGMIAAVNMVNREAAWRNCGALFEANSDRVEHFRGRLMERGMNLAEWCMIVADVDDTNGGVIADLTMPGHDWDQYRARDEKPVARGSVNREWLREVIAVFDPMAAERMMRTENFIVVVVTSGIARVIDPSNMSPSAQPPEPEEP